MDRFRYYYKIANHIINEAEEDAPTPETPPQDTETPPAEDAPPTDMPPAADAPPAEGEAPPTGEPPKDGVKNPVDKIDNEAIIKKVDDKALVILEEQIDKLSIKLLEKKEKISTLEESLAFLNKIDDTKIKKYDKEEKYKKLNGFLTSKEYENLSVSNLFGIHNALKENFKIVQKEFLDKKENKKMQELKDIAKKAKRAKFTKNINSLNKKLDQIKNNLNNINQIFNLQNFSKMSINTQKEIKLAQKNAVDFLKKLS